MTFEENMRIIELKELNSEDQRKVFTRLVCVYYENNADRAGLDEDFRKVGGLTKDINHEIINDIRSDLKNVC